MENYIVDNLIIEDLITFAIINVEKNFNLRKYLNEYKQICKKFGIPDIKNPYAFSHKFINEEDKITDSLNLLRESLKRSL